MLLLTISLCDANIQSVTSEFTEKKSVATSHTTLRNISKIKCVEMCNKERQNGRCTLAGYDKRTKTCYLSDDDPMNVLDNDDEMIGIFYLQDLNGTYSIHICFFYQHNYIFCEHLIYIKEGELLQKLCWVILLHTVKSKTKHTHKLYFNDWHKVWLCLFWSELILISKLGSSNLVTCSVTLAS